MKKEMFKRPVPIGGGILIEVELETEEHALKSDVIQFLESTMEEHNKRVKLSSEVGVIRKFGAAAEEQLILDEAENELVPGDIVLFIKNSGVPFKHEEEDKLYRIICRGDIQAKIGKEIEDE